MHSFGSGAHLYGDWQIDRSSPFLSLMFHNHTSNHVALNVSSEIFQTGAMFFTGPLCEALPLPERPGLLEEPSSIHFARSANLVVTCDISSFNSLSTYITNLLIFILKGT